MLKKIVGIALLLIMNGMTHAADNIEVNTDMGKPGLPTRVPKDNEFKVCADQLCLQSLLHNKNTN